MLIPLLLLAFLQLRAPDSSPLPSASRQLLLVLTPSYEATQGLLYKFQRENASAQWQMVAGAIPIVVGRSGLGWGEGLHAGNPPGRPLKREGDGRSPAGIFGLSSAFGFAPAEELQPLHLPYVQVTAALECVDDAHSQHYNTLVDTQAVDSRDWRSAEKMSQAKIEYRLGVFVDHNFTLRRPDFGSCIFLHIWSTPASPTLGCTAMAAEEMEKIVRWLEREARPVLVQLPQTEYARLREPWHLPVTSQSSKPTQTEKAGQKAPWH